MSPPLLFHASARSRCGAGPQGRVKKAAAGGQLILSVIFASACGSSELDVIERLPASAEPAQPEPPPLTTPEPPLPSSTPLGPPPPTTTVPGPPAPPPVFDAGPEPEPEPAPEPAPVVDSGLRPEPTPEPTQDVDSGLCPSAIVPLNLYRFRSAANDECLAVGNAGFDGFDVVMMDCGANEASWQLIASTSDAYEIRNVLVDYNVDIEFANVAAGSNVVLFAAPGGPSQKFTLTELSNGTVTVNPRSNANLCIHGDPTGVWLERCRAGEATQQWHIDPDECTP